MLSSYCGLNHVKPFTVKDPTGNTWSVATDKVWIAAVKEEGAYPRFLAGIDALNKVVSLIKTDPTPDKSVLFDKTSALNLLNDTDVRYVQVLGVVVERERLIKILKDILPEGSVMWNSTDLVGVPSLGFAAKDHKWYLTGWGNVETFKPMSFEWSLDDILY